jgi:hypothetical protein
VATLPGIGGNRPTLAGGWERQALFAAEISQHGTEEFALFGNAPTLFQPLGMRNTSDAFLDRVLAQRAGQINIPAFALSSFYFKAPPQPGVIIGTGAPANPRDSRSGRATYRVGSRHQAITSTSSEKFFRMLVGTGNLTREDRARCAVALLECGGTRIAMRDLSSCRVRLTVVKRTHR